MNFLLNLTKKNPNRPFAALILNNITGEVLATGLNDTKINPLLHGEIVAMNNCIKKYSQVDWSNVTLYTTAEPCSMCQSAIVWAGISRVVFGTSRNELKKRGWEKIDINASEINEKAYEYKGTLKGGVLSEETDVLF